jgi:hypothetical protein
MFIENQEFFYKIELRSKSDSIHLRNGRAFALKYNNGKWRRRLKSRPFARHLIYFA